MKNPTSQQYISDDVILAIQDWEIEGCEEFIEEFYITNKLNDQQVDQIVESGT